MQSLTHGTMIAPKLGIQAPKVKQPARTTARASAEPVAKAAPPAPSSVSDSDSDATRSSGEESLNSLAWSETSLYLELPSFRTAVEQLHSLYREELQTRHIPLHSQAGCLAGLRRRSKACECIVSKRKHGSDSLEIVCCRGKDWSMKQRTNGGRETEEISISEKTCMSSEHTAALAAFEQWPSKGTNA